MQLTVIGSDGRETKPIRIATEAAGTEKRYGSDNCTRSVAGYVFVTAGPLLIVSTLAIPSPYAYSLPETPHGNASVSLCGRTSDTGCSTAPAPWTRATGTQ